LLVAGLLPGARGLRVVGKAGFWREIEGGWKFSFEIQVKTREKIVPPDKP
jgi:enoyl reductase-like protein